MDKVFWMVAIAWLIIKENFWKVVCLAAAVGIVALMANAKLSTPDDSRLDYQKTRANWVERCVGRDSSSYKAPTQELYAMCTKNAMTLYPDYPQTPVIKEQ